MRLIKIMLITGPLVFVSVLIIVAVSIQKKPIAPTPDILHQEQETVAVNTLTTSIPTPSLLPSPVPPKPGYITHLRELCGQALQLISIAEIPHCPDSINTTDANAYQTRYKIQNTTTTEKTQARHFQITIRANSYFCASGTPEESCTDNLIRGKLQTVDIGPQEAKVITVSRRPKASVIGVNGSLVCGAYQENLFVSRVIDTDTGISCPLPEETKETLIGSGTCMTHTDCIESPQGTTLDVDPSKSEF